MSWEEFKPHRGRYAKFVASVTIQTNGNFSVSAAAWGLLGEPSHCVLMFDAASRMVAIRADHSDSPNAYPVRATNGRSRIISGLRFLRHYCVPVGVKRTFEARKEEDLLVFGPVGQTEVMEVPNG